MANPHAAPTIIDLKTSFLSTQLRLLSQPLIPSPTFLSTPSSSSSPPLRQKSIDEAIHKLNQKLKQHNKLSYGPQAKRHVAEQIDKLYWNAGETGVIVEGDEWAVRGADFRKEGVIEGIPGEWSEDAKERAPELEGRFERVGERLRELNERRKEGRERLEGVKRLRALVDGFEAEGLQENLVTRDGEVEGELEKMRRLLLRVERAVEGAGGVGEGGEEDTMDLDGVEEEKLLGLLGGP